MSPENTQHNSLKQKAAHEFTEIAIVFLYLAFIFCALATYSMLLLQQFEISYFNYGAALLNALIITKIILIGEAVHLGKKYEATRLVYSCVYKALIYGLLVFAFHLVEELVKRLAHGKDIVGAFHEVRLDELLARVLIIFCTFIPFFAFRELGRSLGPEKFRSLFFGTGAAPKSGQ